MKKIFTTLMALAVVTAVFSQEVLFSENFDDGAADLRWNVSEDGENSSDFIYDYVTAGIPAAPNGGGLGLKFESNLGVLNPDGLASQIYAFPADQAFSGRYIVSFDLWVATDTSGSGTTEFAIFGVMHTTEDVPSYDGIDYAFTSEYGSSKDIRVYEEGVELLAADGEGGYRLGPDGLPLQNMNLDEGLSVYQDDFEGTMPFGQWLAIDIYVTPEELIWTLNDSVWSSMPNLLDQEGNISLGYMDIFSSVASPAGAMFGLYDNVVVSSYPGVGIESDGVEVSTVSVFPNPVSSFMNIELAKNATFELINSAGQVVLSRDVTAGTSTINLSDVSRGIYFGRFNMEDGATEVHKIVVNK